ncbi:MAG: DNA double-strand break repair nuclease NurA [Candidatus Thorarchaeota archaeon]|jgi:hypothetical protein
MLEKILTDKFRKLVRAVLSDVRNQQDLRDEKEFTKDEDRIKNELLDTIVPYPADVILDEDFTVAAVDGSGTENFGILDDVRLHLVSTSIVVVESNTKNGSPFEPAERAKLQSELDQEQPHLDMHWHSGVRNDARDKLAASLSNIYPNKTVTDLVVHFFRDLLGPQIADFSSLDSTDYAKHNSRLDSMQGLISRVGMITNSVVHEELRKVSEYAAARSALMSGFQLKYLLLDGAMSVFLHPTLKYPSLPSGFMLRELCSLARDRKVTLCAVSKNHTIPFAHRIAKLAEEKFGESSKWFCLLPSQNDPGGDLHIYRDRTYIPPHLAVPYLFSFGRENRPSRIDFDRVWWKKNIFVRDDPDKTRENEKALFKEIEFMSRDARWYGYPVALALAHEQCKLSYQDLRIAQEVFADVLHEVGTDSRRSAPMREDYGL